jgi:signal transduction histidine kinase
MELSQWLTLGACAVQLTLAFIVLLRAFCSPLAKPLALLCLNIFTWSIAKLAFQRTGQPVWSWIEAASSPGTTVFAIQFILAFIGQRHQKRYFLWACYAVFGLLSLASAAAFLSPAAQQYVASGMSKRMMFVCTVPFISVAAVLLARHALRATTADEQARAWLLLAVFTISSPLLLSELMPAMGLPVPQLGNVGALLGTATMTLVVLRYRLLSAGELPSIMALLAFSLALFTTLGCFAALQLGNRALGWLLSLTLAFVLFLSLRQAIASFGKRRQQEGRLAIQGRFSAQMAHDLRNPLAALKGAAQYLREERQRGASLDERSDFLDLMVDQIARLERTVDEYHRMGRMDLRRVAQPVNPLVERVLEMQSFVCMPKTNIAKDLSADLPDCAVDSDLLTRALENICRNAVEAMPEGGRLTVRTSLDSHGQVVVSFADTGCGMDARTRERAEEAFFTTKPQGSGLGLAFVRNVVESHGGRLKLSSEPSRGTTVTLRLPTG